MKNEETFSKEKIKKRLNFIKAVVCTKYGPPDVLQLKEVEKPASIFLLRYII